MTPLSFDLLLALHAAKPYGFTTDTLLADMRQRRHRALTLPELETALRELADKRLAAPVEGLLSDRWRITALGDSALAEEGLA